MIYLTSDLHLFHNKEFLYEPRGFRTIEEHNEAIIKNWNSIVDPDDDVYVLGDLILNDNEGGARAIKQLKGRIHVVLGNHDTDTRIDIYNHIYNIVEMEYGLRLKYQGYNFFLSHYPTLCGNHDNDKPLNRRVINLCGHTHSQDRWCDFDKGLIYHCELDAHNNFPISIEQIINDIKGEIKE